MSEVTSIEKANLGIMANIEKMENQTREFETRLIELNKRKLDSEEANKKKNERIAATNLEKNDLISLTNKNKVESASITAAVEEKTKKRDEARSKVQYEEKKIFAIQKERVRSVDVGKNS
jgi:low affinity Fe/Cu permease